MDFNLTNEEIVYLFLHMKAYKDVIDRQYEKDLPFMRKHIEFMEETYDDFSEEEKKYMKIHKELITEALPEATKVKIDFLNGFLEKLSPIYEMIEESDPDYVESVKGKLIETSEKVKNLSNQLKGKFYGGQDLI